MAHKHTQLTNSRKLSFESTAALRKHNRLLTKMNTNTCIAQAIKMIKNKNVKNEEEQIDMIVPLLSTLAPEFREEAIDRLTAFCVSFNKGIRTEDSNVSWGDVVAREEGEKDARFVTMTPQEWMAEQQMAKRQHRFPSWDAWVTWVRRIDEARRPKPVTRVITREVDSVGRMLNEYRELKERPQYYAASQASYDGLEMELMNAVRSYPGGGWRLEMEFQKERPALQLRIDEIIAQVKATQSVKMNLRNIAARNIQRKWMAVHA